MFCESKSTVVNNLRERGILGPYNEVLNVEEFNTINKEYTRKIELEFPGITQEGELLFTTFETHTKMPFRSTYYRDDIRNTVYAQANNSLFDALDEERTKADIREELQDYDILKEPDAVYPEDESLDPMFMRGPSQLKQRFDTKLRQGMLSFLEGLNIKVDTGAKEIISAKKRTYTDRNGNVVVKDDPMAGFDILQKFLALKENISDKDLAMQTANIIYSFLGKKSKLGLEIWKGINNWSKYETLYKKYEDIYDNRPNKGTIISRDELDASVADSDNPYQEDQMVQELLEEEFRLVLSGTLSKKRFNPWIHNQIIREFIADMLVVGIDNNYIGKKRKNPDISKDYFESIGYRDKYADNFFIRMFNKLMNWIQENIYGNKAVTIYKEAELIDTVLDIVDDVFKKDYTKFIRGYYQDLSTGEFISSKGEVFEQKFYDESLKRDPFAKEIVDKLFVSPFDYVLSGSLVLRKYGRLLRSISEELHDIDGVITLDQFRSEKNAEEFLKWIQERGLPLSKERSKKNSEQFKKEVLPYLEQQSWYQDLKNMFPSWTFDTAFIGRDHKIGESITITGYVEHPTEMETVQEDYVSYGGRVSERMVTRPKRYVLDFFLRTQEGNYPDWFNNYYLDWKQIFEAKIKMGRGKDMTDLIYFEPFYEDRYKFTNKGFRYFTFANDAIIEKNKKVDFQIQEDKIKNARAKEAAEALGMKIAQALGVNYMNITPEQARTILSSRKKEYADEPAFYYGRTVYIVGDNVNFDTVLHELSHPLLRAISNENPELFKNLYDNLLTTEEGKILKQHVIDNYPKLNETFIDQDGNTKMNPLFMEEVLAYALQRRAVNKATQKLESEGFETFMSRLLDALRNMLKKIFGSVKVSKIDVNTSIEDLAEMLLEKDFKYNTENIKDEDIVSYIREVKSMANSLVKDLKADKIQESLNEQYVTYQLIYDKVLNFKTKSGKYKDQIKEVLIEKGTQQLLPRLKSTLSGYQTVTNKNLDVDEIITEAINAEKLRMEDIHQRARAFVTTVGVINNIAKNIFQDLDQMDRNKEFNNRDAMALLFLYRNAIRAWNGTFESFDELLSQEDTFNINQQNDLTDLVNEAKNNLLRSDKKIRDIYKQNAVNFYVEITGHMNDFLKEELGKNLKDALTNKLSNDEIEQLYNAVITQNFSEDQRQPYYQMLQKKGIEAKYIQRFIDKYEDFLNNQDTITDGLSGKLKDVSWFNRFFESYTSSNDPIVGGLAIFINDQKTEASQRALDKSYKLRKKLEGLLNKVGFNKFKTTQIRDLVATEDSILYIDPKTKEAKERKIYTFLNEFGNGWRYKEDLLEYEVVKANESEDKDKIRQAEDNLRQFRKDYMWDEFIPEVYEKDKIFEKYGDVGKRAWLARKMALDAFNAENNEISNELERYQKYSTLQELWRNYLSLFSYVYDDGSAKVDDPANGVYDLSIAKILNEYKEATSDFYEFTPRPGSLQTSFNEFLLELQEKQADLTPEEFDNAKKQWVKQNIRVAYSQDFYDSRKDLISRLRGIQDKINQTVGEEFDMASAYNEIYNLMFVYKDEQGQPVPELLGEDKVKRIKELNQKIIDFKAMFDVKTGLSNEESEELQLYIAVHKKDPNRLTDEQKARYRSLLEKQSKSGLTVAEIATMQSIYSELASLTQKVPTEYYLDALNEHMQRLNLPTLTTEEVDDFINGSEIKEIIKKDGKFVDWFRANHVSRKIKNKRTRKTEIKYERSMVNSIAVPKNEAYYRKVTLFNEITGIDETFNGMPNARHSTFRIKNKYRTGYNPQTGEVELIVGVHVNNRNEFLPRMYNQNDPNSAKNDDYINKEYMALKQNPNSSRFQLLETLKEAHLEFQLNKSNKSKLYLDLPRYMMRDTLSRIQAGKVGKGLNQIKLSARDHIKTTFGKAVDDSEREYNYDRDNNLEEYKLVNTDLNGNEISYIPVTGLYNYELDDTDPDVIRGMFRYLLSLETQEQLFQTLPLVNSILETLEDPVNAPKTANTASRNIQRVANKIKFTTKPGAANNRLGQVKSLIEREYYGVQFNSQGSSVYLDKFFGFIQGASARASLALNLPSDFKNRYGQIVQNFIEAAGGENVTLRDLGKARIWAAKSMLEWSAKSVYASGVPALSSQMIDMFDSAFRFQDDFGRSISRNFSKDMMNLEFMYSIRKNLEMEAALQLFGAFLNGQKVERKLSNGKTITISYMDAWEVDKDTGIAKLKSGIDPAWSNKAVYHTYTRGQSLEDIANMYGITVEQLKERNKITNVIELSDNQEIVISKSEKFKQFKNKFQGVSHRLYGSYDKFAQSEGNLYLPYRMFMFMRKWFTPMFVNRLGVSVDASQGIGKVKLKPRYDWMTGKPTIGFYINAFQGMTDLVRSKGKYWSYMPAQQKADLMRTLSESLFIITIGILTAMVFGYDPDDEDRFDKMRERSGALFKEDFKTWGFMQNHILLLLLGIQGETSAFIPLPAIAGVNLGTDDYIKMFTTTTSAFGNTVTLYAKIFDDIIKMVSGNEKAYYSRKEGEYWWQQEGQPKIYGHLLKTVGITGSTGDVTQAIEGVENSGRLK